MTSIRVAVTSARRRTQLAGLLERRGLDVIEVPMVGADTPTPRDTVVEQTRAALDARPRFVTVATGVGLRLWREALEGTDLAGDVERMLADAHVLARGAKAHGPLRATGIEPVFVSPQETDADLFDWLGDRVLAGDVVVTVQHGAGEPRGVERLHAAGATVVAVTPYHTSTEVDEHAAEQLRREVADGRLDVIACTSPAAAAGVGAVGGEVTAAVRAGAVVGAAVGAVTAAAMESAGLPVSVMPLRARSADLVRAIEGWSARRPPAPVPPPILLDPVARTADVAGEPLSFAPREFAVLAALVRRPDVVCGHDVLAREGWGHDAPTDPAHVKHQVARVRRKLGGAAAAVTTVRGRGYRYVPAAVPAPRPAP